MRISLKHLAIMTLAIYLSGCTASTPLVLAGTGNHQFLKYKQDIRLRGAAALDEEPDLITYSINGISDNKTEDVVTMYLKGYSKSDYSQDMKSIALYQIGLIYMNRFNENRDDEKAKLYFHRHLIEFPYSILQHRIHSRLDLIETRKQKSVKMTPSQLLAQVDRNRLLSQSKTRFDEDLTPMSVRAIKEDRLEDANGIYITVYENPGSSDSIKAKSMYQLGLIYMSPHNKEASIKRSTFFFRKIIAEFPNTRMAKKAEHRISMIINKQD